MDSFPVFIEIRPAIASSPIARLVFQTLKGLEQNSSRMLLAFSGGPDSTALLIILWSLGMDVEAAHVNYHLRGADSDSDAEFCKHLCAVLDIKYHQKEIDPGSLKSEKNCSFQDIARDIRYQYFFELLVQHTLDTVVTAHHLDDSIESFFINLIRGTGINGLTGIPLNRTNIARPLLSVKKSDIKGFLKQFNIPCRTDKSNDEEIYRRNEVRKQILPKLLEIQPSFRSVMQSNLERISSESRIIDSVVVSWKHANLQGNGSLIYIRTTDLTPEVEPAFIYQLLKPYGLQWSETKKFIQAIFGQPGKQFETQSHRLLIDRDQILIRIKRELPVFKEINLSEKDIQIERSISLPNGMLHFTLIDHLPPLHIQDDTSIFMDIETIQFPITVRHPIPGDRFRPFGLDGKHQKVFAYLTHQKVNLFEKENVTLLEDQNEILWIIGYRKSELFKEAYSKGQRFLKVRLMPLD